MLLADQRNQAAYQAHIRAVFEELHGIPFNMIDLPLAGECRVIEALLLLMELPIGEFTRPEVLKILTHPAVRARFPEANVEPLARLVSRARDRARGRSHRSRRHLHRP